MHLSVEIDVAMERKAETIERSERLRRSGFYHLLESGFLIDSSVCSPSVLRDARK